MDRASVFIQSNIVVSGILSLALLIVAGRIVAQSEPVENSETTDYRIAVVADGLNHPWGLGFLPNGNLLVTERAGRLRMIRQGELLAKPINGVPDVFASSQGGLLDILIDPDFEQNSLIYLSLAHGNAEANTTRVIRTRLEELALVDTEILFNAEPMKDTPVHYGGRMTWLTDGTLAIALGDGFDYREQAQILNNHFGTIVRIQKNGRIPTDNPFIGQTDAMPEIYSYGHRNIQGLVLDPVTGTLWQHEHGPRGGDEINRIVAGKNYGWPVATHGIDYSGALISPYRSRPAMIDPELIWTPSIAPSGMTMYRGEQFPGWNGDLFVTTLVDRNVRRIDLENGTIRGQEVLFEEIGQRLRDIRTGPNGELYILTDANPGQVLKVESAARIDP